MFRSAAIKRILALILVTAVAFAAASCDSGIFNAPSFGFPEESEVVSEPSGSPEVSEISKIPVTAEVKAAVHFIDVGQGDSIFIELPGGKCMLIDCGERETVGRVVTYIDCLGYKTIDWLVVTHPHSDHMGGMSVVVESFGIGKIYMPDCAADTDGFLNFLDAVEAKGLKIDEAAAGVDIGLGEGCEAHFLGPVGTEGFDLNNCSAVMKFVCGEKSFLFTGDAERAEEESILKEYGEELECDVLKAGHHGSRTSSSASFLKKCKASVAVISCGADNSYGHPHEEALKRLENAGIKTVWRTDISGTVRIYTDGKELYTLLGTPGFDHKWVLNIAGKKIHAPGCSGAASMAERNRAYSVRTVAELTALGYETCGSCKPKD